MKLLKLFSNFITKPSKSKQKTSTKILDNNLKNISKNRPQIKTIIQDKSDIYNEFVVIDVETTGLSQSTDKIVEIAALKYKNKEQVDTFHTLINPKIKIPKRITKIHGITNEMVKFEPCINEVIDKLESFIGNLPIIGHNVMFDIGFIQNALKDFYKDNLNMPNQFIDTVKLSRKMYPKLENHKLGTIINHLDIAVDKRHRAFDDAKATAQIYLNYCDYMENKKSEQSNKISQLIKKIDFSEDELLCYEIVKNILLKNNRSLEYVRCTRVGSYTDIKAFYSFCRIKFKGRKFYVISDIPMEELSNILTNFKLEKTIQSEKGKTRIIINTPDDILKLENLIVQSFDKSIESMEHYRKNVGCGERNIQSYLSSFGN